MNAYEERVFKERGWVVMDDAGCLSGDPECANGPRPSVMAALCSACTDREEACPICGANDCGYDAEHDVCPTSEGYWASR